MFAAMRTQKGNIWVEVVRYFRRRSNAAGMALNSLHWNYSGLGPMY